MLRVNAQSKRLFINYKGFSDRGLAIDVKDSVSVYKKVDSAFNQLLFEGYFKAELTYYNWVSDTLFVHFRKNDRFTFACVKNGNIPETVLTEIHFREKLYQQQQFSLTKLTELKNTLLNWYENNGYPFAQVWLDSLQFTDNEVFVSIYSHPGSLIKLDELNLVGSAKVQPGYLTSFLGLKARIYQENQVKSIYERLNKLSFLEQPKPPEVIFSGDNAQINLFLNKKNANQFDGLIGFLSDAETGKLQLTGDFNLKLHNALKHSESLGFNYRGLPGQSQELLLNTSYPYLLGTQISLQADFSFFKRDSSFLNINTRLGFLYNYSLDKSIGVYFESFNSNTVADADSMDLNAGDISTQFYGLQTQINQLDNEVFPHRGITLRFSGGIGNRAVQDSLLRNTGNQVKMQLQARIYLPLKERAVLFLHHQSAFLSGNHLYDNELFRIGGLKSFRGFDEQSLAVKSFVLQTIEFQYYMEKTSFLNIFYDQGAVSQLGAKKGYFTYPFGFGAGFTFQTKAGLLSLQYALGKQQNNPLDLQRGKVHFGISSFF